MKKFYYPADSTLKKNILKFLDNPEEEQMLVVDLAFNNEEEDYKYCDEFYITKPTTKNQGDFLNLFLTDMLIEDGIEEVPKNVLLGFHAFKSSRLTQRLVITHIFSFLLFSHKGFKVIRWFLDRGSFFSKSLYFPNFNNTVTVILSNTFSIKKLKKVNFI